MSYGAKIAALRKQKGMTQAALGAELNVTYQAVSKWERDESDPDFATMTKIAKLFDVPLTYFAEDGEEPAAAQEEEIVAIEETVETSEEVVVLEAEPAEPRAQENASQSQEQAAPLAAPAVTPAPSQERQPARMLGVCSVCGKSVYEGNVGEQSTALVCKSCVAKRAEAKANPKKEQKRREVRYTDYETSRLQRRRNIGLIASACITLAILIASIVGMAKSEMEAGYIAGASFAIVIFLYPFIAQLFWDGFIVEVVLAGVKVIGTPGIIFTLDLDGIIFLIVMKILFAVLKFFVLMLIFLFMCFVAIVLSPFAIVPQAIKISRGEEL